MNIKTRLNNLKYFDTKLNSLRQERIALRAAVQKAQIYSDEPKGSKQGNKTEDLNVRIITESERIDKEMEKLWNERNETAQAIESLEDPLENVVMRWYYINGCSRFEVMRKVNCSRTTFHRVKKSAIEHLEAKL